MNKINGTRDEIIAAIDNNVIGFKSIRNRAILKDHFIDGLTYEEVAEKHGISTRQAKQIAHNYTNSIRQYVE